MSYSLLFALAVIVNVALPCIVTVLIFEQARPRHPLLRLLLAVLSGWTLFFLCSMFVYRPAGIALGHAQGVHFPENRYDNNIGAVALIAGWLWPVLALVVYPLLRLIWNALRPRR